MIHPDMTLTDAAQKDLDSFLSAFDGGGCTCFVSPPCNWCVHPGNPNNLAEDPDAWVQSEVSKAVSEAHATMNVFIEELFTYHLRQMRFAFALRDASVRYVPITPYLFFTRSKPRTAKGPNSFQPPRAAHDYHFPD